MRIVLFVVSMFLVGCVVGCVAIPDDETFVVRAPAVVDAVLERETPPETSWEPLFVPTGQPGFWFVVPRGGRAPFVVNFKGWPPRIVFPVDEGQGEMRNRDPGPSGIAPISHN